MSTELAEALAAGRDRLAQAQAVLLPDLYVDHLVPLEDRGVLAEGVDRLVGQGGGNLLTGDQRLELGGNAANTAHALARLGVPTTLIARTDEVGRALFEEAIEELPAGTEGLKPAERASSTVALELDGEQANVMLSDPGPLARFGPDDLDETAWGWIEGADVVCVTNWAQTLEHGTELVSRVVERASVGGAFTFLDTGDPAHRGGDVDELLTSASLREDLSGWGMNEHEARWFAGVLTDRKPFKLGLAEAAQILAEHVDGRVDVHTADEALSLVDGRIEKAATFDVTPVQRTGAGDAWNAGNLAGTLLDLPDRRRLRLANAVAALAISDRQPGPPTLDQVRGFVSEG